VSFTPPFMGHSFMLADSDFGLIRIILNKTERFYTADEFIELRGKSLKRK
jgi:hypothetical protein